MKALNPVSFILILSFFVGGAAQARDCDGVLCVVDGKLEFEDAFINDAAQVGIFLDGGSEQVGKSTNPGDRDFDNGLGDMNKDVSSAAKDANNGEQAGQAAGGGPAGAGSPAGGSANNDSLNKASFNDLSVYEDNKPKIGIPDINNLSSDGETETASTVKPLLDPQFTKGDPRNNVSHGGRDGNRPAQIAGQAAGFAPGSFAPGGQVAAVRSGGETYQDSGGQKRKQWSGFFGAKGTGGVSHGRGAGGSEKGTQVQERQLAANKKSRNAKKLLQNRWSLMRKNRSISSTGGGFGPRDVFIFSGMCVHYQGIGLGKTDDKVVCPPKK